MIWQRLAFILPYPRGLTGPRPWIRPGWLLYLVLKSGGLFIFIWFYRNWRLFRAISGKSPAVGLRTAALAIPFVNYLLIRDFSLTLQRLTEGVENGGERRFSLLLSLGLSLQLLMTCLLEAPWLLVMLLWPVTLLVNGLLLMRLQRRLNVYLEQAAPILCGKIDYLGTMTERVILFSGQLLWFPVIYWLLIAPVWKGINLLGGK